MKRFLVTGNLGSSQPRSFGIVTVQIGDEYILDARLVSNEEPFASVWQLVVCDDCVLGRRVLHRGETNALHNSSYDFP